MYDFNLPTSAQQQVKVETTSSVSSKSDTSVAACKPQEGDATAAATEKSAFGEITSCENGASQQLTSEQQQMTFHFPTPPNEDGEVPSANSTLAQQEKAASKPSTNNEPNIILNGGSIASYNEQELGNKLSSYPSGGTNGGDSKSSMSSAYSSAMHTQSFAQQQDGNDVAKYAVSTNSLSTSQYSNSTLAKKKSRTNACELRFVVRNLK